MKINTLSIGWERDGFNPRGGWIIIQASEDGSILDWFSMHGSPADRFFYPYAAATYELLDQQMDQATASDS